MLAEYIPSKSTYTRPGSRKRKYPNGTGFINDHKSLMLVKKYFGKRTSKEICAIVGCKISTYKVIVKKLGLRREIKRTHRLGSKIGDMMELFFYHKKTPKEISVILGCSHTTVSYYLKKMFCVKMTENTTVIVRQSKINET